MSFIGAQDKRRSCLQGSLNRFRQAERTYLLQVELSSFRVMNAIGTSSQGPKGGYLQISFTVQLHQIRLMYWENRER